MAYDSCADENTLLHVGSIFNLGHEKASQIAPGDSWKSAQRESFADAVSPGRRAIDQPCRIHECPVKVAATQQFLAGFLVAVEVLEQQAHENSWQQRHIPVRCANTECRG